MKELFISPDTRFTAGLMLLTIVGIEYGGIFMLKIVRGQQAMTPFQTAFARAGHAHAGVLVILALVGLLYADASRMTGWGALVARNGIGFAAILMPAGFFLSSIGKNVTQPNKLVWLIYAGVVSLGLGLISLGIGLLTS